jgi:hypothetical protein
VAEIPEQFDYISPTLWDVFVILASATGPTWLAVRYQVVNSGQLDGGMSVIILDEADEWP